MRIKYNNNIFHLIASSKVVLNYTEGKFQCHKFKGNLINRHKICIEFLFLQLQKMGIFSHIFIIVISRALNTMCDFFLILRADVCLIFYVWIVIKRKQPRIVLVTVFHFAEINSTKN